MDGYRSSRTCLFGTIQKGRRIPLVDLSYNSLGNTDLFFDVGCEFAISEITVLVFWVLDLWEYWEYLSGFMCII